ncbi:hypothetical protein GRJ2_003181700 [Grus japonensis]|uniref:Uncharacterized protein n=1 Tax=Grus japonensis TaxID=30415 RepID=A0ABC9YB48_GRUJA
MGLGPWAVVDGKPRHHAAQHWVQGLPVVHTLPGSTKKPLQPSNNGMGLIKDSVPNVSPHHSITALPHGRNQAEPKVHRQPEGAKRARVTRLPSLKLLEEELSSHRAAKPEFTGPDSSVAKFYSVFKIVLR